jgi:hypothetical protein
MTMVDSLWGGSMEVYEIMTMVDSLWGGFMEVYERWLYGGLRAVY